MAGMKLLKLVIYLFIFITMFDNLQNQDLVERRRQALEASANQRYQDMLSDLNRQQDVFKGQFDTGMRLGNEQLAAARSLASQNALTQERQARGTYEDLITQARQRARAMGGVTGSGVLDMYGDVDRNLQQNLYGIGQGRERSISEAQMGANEQFARLQNEYNSRIAQIEADRTKSLREKNDLLSEIEFGYLGALDKLNKARSGGGSGYGAYDTTRERVYGDSIDNTGGLTLKEGGFNPLQMGLSTFGNVLSNPEVQARLAAERERKRQEYMSGAFSGGGAAGGGAGFR